MAMIRARAAAGSRAPFRLLYSVRDPAATSIYADELRRRVRDDRGLDVTYVYTREPPEGWPAGRAGSAAPTSPPHGWPPEFEPACFVCGPTGFVETAADLLVALGHDAAPDQDRAVRTDWRRPMSIGRVPRRQRAGRPAARDLRRRREHARRRRCAGCGTVDVGGRTAGLRRTRPGLVARCPGCEDVVLRLVRGPDRAWLDLRGTVALRIPLP